MDEESEVRKPLSREKSYMRSAILSRERESFSRKGSDTVLGNESDTILTEDTSGFCSKENGESDDDDFWNIPITVKGDFESEDDDDEEWSVTPTVKEDKMVVVKESFDNGITSKEKFLESNDMESHVMKRGRSDDRKERNGAAFSAGSSVSFSSCGPVTFFFK